MPNDTTKPANEVFLDNNDLVRIIYHGPQTRLSLGRVINRAMVTMERLAVEDKPVNVLADIRDMGEHTPAARMTGLRARTVMPFLKMAIIVPKNDGYTTKISRIMTSMSGHKKEIRYYRSESAAVKWLGQS